MGQQTTSLKEEITPLIVPGKILLAAVKKHSTETTDIAEADAIWRQLENKINKKAPTKQDLWECMQLYRAALQVTLNTCLYRKLTALRNGNLKEALAWETLAETAQECVTHCP